MERWQKEGIDLYLVELMKATICTNELLVALMTNKLLSDDDFQTITQVYKTDNDKSMKLYQILRTRVGSFEILCKLLHQTRQTEALHILSKIASKQPNNPTVVDENLTDFLHKNPRVSTEEKENSNAINILSCHVSFPRIKITFQNEHTVKFGSCCNLPFKVGLSNHNMWFCGSDIDSKIVCDSQYFKKIWRLEDTISRSTVRWKEEIEFDQELQQITTEFLLAIFFSHIKKTVCCESKRNISTIVVAVPYWFSSFQRRQFVDGGKLAGFEFVRIVNENSAAAFGCLDTGSENVVVITDNTNKIDVSLYHLDNMKGRVSLLAHSGENELGHNVSDMEITTTVGRHIVNYTKSQEIITTDIKNKICNLLSLTLQKVNFRFIPKAVLICSESKDFSLFSLAVLKQFEDVITDDNNCVLHGLHKYIIQTMLKNSVEVGSLIEDKTPFHICVENSNGQIPVTYKDNGSNISLEIAGHILKKSPCLTVSQKHATNRGSIGRIILKKGPMEFGRIKINLSRSIDSIYSLASIEEYPDNKKEKYTLKYDNFEWVTLSLKTDQLRKFGLMIKKFVNGNSAACVYSVVIQNVDVRNNE